MRIEITQALASHHHVIPVLMEDAPMPSAEQLPVDLAPLTKQNATRISDSRFDYDLDKLIYSIERLYENVPLF